MIFPLRPQTLKPRSPKDVAEGNVSLTCKSIQLPDIDPKVTRMQIRMLPSKPVPPTKNGADCTAEGAENTKSVKPAAIYPTFPVSGLSSTKATLSSPLSFDPFP